MVSNEFLVHEAANCWINNTQLKCPRGKALVDAAWNDYRDVTNKSLGLIS